ncbi:MAG: tRNA pseudouridine(38-40) synthase TruA [Eubacteriales bacterium]
MKRIKLVVAYDGTNYCGWQIQPNGITIEAELNKHLSNLLQEKIKVIGASRTDSGVHARGNVAIFDTNTTISPKKIAYALNHRLPEDIRVQQSNQVADDFHPRRCYSVKTYHYNIESNPIPLPTNRFYSYFTYYQLNIEHMRQASRYLVGEHDFKSFCASGSSVESTVRTITDIQIMEKDTVITIQVSGTGFLYNMVRIIAGTLYQVGQGKLGITQVKDILESCYREKAGPTLPAKGLMLYELQYEELATYD